MTLEGDTLLQLQKWWDTISSAFWQSLSTNKSWPSYKKLKAEHYNITKFLPHQTTILNTSQKKKMLNHSQEHSELIFLKITPSHHQKHKIIYQTCYWHKLWKWIWNEYLIFLIRDPPTQRTWNQIWRPCDILLPRWIIVSTRFSAQIPFNQKWTCIDER